MNNGVDGLMAFTNAMGAISNNIANLTTVGYKRSETNFSDMVGEFDVPGRGGGPVVNGSPPMANSNLNGVRTQTIQLISTQGQIQTTSRSLDVAINGSGFYTFTSDPTSTANSNITYGRAGSFQLVIPPGNSTTAFLANTSGQYLLAYPVTAGVTDTSQLVPVQVSQTSFAGTPTTTGVMDAVLPAAGATTATAPFSYIDTNGVSQTMSLTFTNPTVVSGTSTTWTVTAADANGNSAGTGSITFDQFGTASSGTSLAITANSTSIPSGGSAATTSFSLDMSKVAMLGDATSVSNGSALVQVVSYTQDGLPAGNFEQLAIGSDGKITNQYSGGATSVAYQIPLAVFQAPNALQANSGDTFTETEGSGEPSYVLPGGAFSSLQSGAVESSNVDLADSFAQMIITQRAYQSAAQVVKVADEMTTTVTQLKT
jgi:flagellar hook protein FlgE